jgi:hypothetical protein
LLKEFFPLRIPFEDVSADGRFRGDLRLGSNHETLVDAAGLRLGKCPLMADSDVRWHAPE